MSDVRVTVKKNNRAEILRKLQSATVYAGLPANSDAYPDGTSVVQVATEHEFGSDKARTYTSPRGNTITVSGVPERSFMRSTAKESRRAWANMAKKNIRNILKMKMDSKTALGRLGTVMRDSIKEKIVAIQNPENSEKVRADKGGSNPLIDTGHMLNSITYDVRDK